MTRSFVESSDMVIAAAVRREPAPPNRIQAALIAALERKTNMTAENFRTLSSWVAAAFLSMLMLTAAVTSHPILI